MVPPDAPLSLELFVKRVFLIEAANMISPLQLAIVGLVILLLFGHRLPMLARSLGSSLIEFKKGVKESDDSPVVPHTESK